MALVTILEICCGEPASLSPVLSIEGQSAGICMCALRPVNVAGMQLRVTT